MRSSDLEEDLARLSADRRQRQQEFFRYYSPKRVQHQVKQLEMLSEIPAGYLVEIGSYLGFATSLFMAAGHTVCTVDAGPVDLLGSLAPAKHIQKNILDLTHDDLENADVVVCCETLEHIPFAKAAEIVGRFAKANVQWLLISVPYKCFSLDTHIVLNPIAQRFRWSCKPSFSKMKTFRAGKGWNDHKWELGYKGYGLSRLQDMLKSWGFEQHRIDYSGTVRSVFILSHLNRSCAET